MVEYPPPFITLTTLSQENLLAEHIRAKYSKMPTVVIFNPIEITRGIRKDICDYLKFSENILSQLPPVDWILIQFASRESAEKFLHRYEHDGGFGIDNANFIKTFAQNVNTLYMQLFINGEFEADNT